MADLAQTLILESPNDTFSCFAGCYTDVSTEYASLSQVQNAQWDHLWFGTCPVHVRAEANWQREAIGKTFTYSS